MEQYSYYQCLTRSGKLLSRSGEKGDAVSFARIWMGESPYYDPADPLLIEQVFLGDDGTISHRKIIKEY